MKKIIFLFALILIASSYAPKKLIWVAIGDSITSINENAEKSTQGRVTKGYMTLVNEKYPQIKYHNQGYSGWTSRNIAEKFDTLNVQVGDVYSIFLGTNDWWQGRNLGIFSDYANNTGNETVYGSYRIIIDKIRKLNKNASIFLITPMQRVDFVWLFGYTNKAYGSYQDKAGQKLEQFAEAINKIGDFENFSVVDLYHTKALSLPHLVKYKHVKDPASGEYKNLKYPDFIDIPFDPATDDYPYPIDSIDMTYDGLHPSDKGYAVIAKKIIKVFKKL